MFAIVALAGAYTLATQHFSHPVSVTVNLPSAVNVSDWKTFESRGGWSIRYPPIGNFPVAIRARIHPMRACL
ncbi:MAG: hypothetical protein WDN06_06385 [Asticcacaulis sp.]